MIKKIILSIITLSALLVGQKAYWVDVTNGNDSNDGSSENQAFKTIQYFTSSVNWADGDTLYVKPSEDGSGNLTYYDFGNNAANINSSNDLVIIGTGGRDRTIFDAESKNRHFEKNGTGDLTIKGITFQNGKINNSTGGSIDLMGSGKATFIDVTWKNNVAEEIELGDLHSIASAYKFISESLENSKENISKGYLVIKKPDYMLWHINDPTEKVIMFKEGLISIYDPDLYQVIKTEIDEFKEANWIRILMGESELIENYEQKIDVFDSHTLIRFEPLFKDPIGNTFTIKIKEGLIEYIDIEQSERERIYIAFQDIDINEKIDDQFFDGLIPNDVDVIE